MANNWQFIFSTEDVARVTVNDDGSVSLDLHGFTCKEAKRFLSNIISLCRTQEKLCVIHGFNRGCVLKMLLLTDFIHERVYRTVPDEKNPGRTYLYIS